MNTIQGLAELVAVIQEGARCAHRSKAAGGRGQYALNAETLDAIIAALSQQPAAGAVAWTWERFISEGFCGDGGYWLREYGDERPEILFQEDLDDPTKYRGLQPLYAKGAQHEQ